ncbi:MAG: hypothetical protein WBI55_05120 [Eubacteriales bacterium]|nr:hypothetical protein [Clostridiales bacterium]
MKKYLCVLLALFMIALPLVSCSDPKEGGDDTNNAESYPESTTGAATEEILEIPQEDFDGYTFTILTGGPETYNWSRADFDEPSEDAYENAMYERNLAIEELLDIVITSVEEGRGGNTYNLFKTSTQAVSGDYDCAFLTLTHSATATGAGLCLTWDNLEYVDLTKSWWNKASVDQLSLGGNTYMVAGEAMLSDKECLWLVYFLKDKIKDWGLEDPYELVANNKWTWDKMMEMAAVIVDDINGDGVMDKNDCWGLTTHGENYAALWMAAGHKLIELDKDGIPYQAWGTEEFFTIFEKIAEIMGNTEVVYGTDIAFISDSLKQNRTLFGTEVVAFIKAYRGNEYEFGLLPMPKYDSSQEDYYTYAAVNSDLCVVGLDCADTYRTSIILEALACYGKKILLPVYYEEQLRTRFARDEESGAMLDIIFKNRMYDLGVAFDWGSVKTSLSSYTANPASLYASLEKSINKSMAKSLEKAGILN